MSLSDPLTADVAIIGAGPVGLFAVFQCGMLGLSAAVLDALPEIGGQCTALYPEKPIYDIPGAPAILAAELIDRLAAQAAPFHPQYLLGHAVTALERLPDGAGFQLRTADGRSLQVRAVLIAAGAGAFGPNRPPLAGLPAFEAAGHVHYAVRHRARFAGQSLVIAGGGDSAVDWAISLADIAARILVIHRRDSFRAAPESVARMRALAAEGRLEILVPWQLDALEGEEGHLKAVRLRDLDGTVRTEPADHLLAFFGLATELGPIRRWGLTLERSQIRVDPTTAETNEPGIFAIGDVAAYPHKLKLILTGFSEAAFAAHRAFAYARPGVALHFEHSTSRGVPAASASSAASASAA